MEHVVRVVMGHGYHVYGQMIYLCLTSGSNKYRVLLLMQDFKGTAITAIKLNPVRDYLAFGTSRGFIQVERLLKITV